MGAMNVRVLNHDAIEPQENTTRLKTRTVVKVLDAFSKIKDTMAWRPWGRVPNAVSKVDHPLKI